jgi:hypothetical protein
MLESNAEIQNLEYLRFLVESGQNKRTEMVLQAVSKKFGNKKKKREQANNLTNPRELT